MTLQGYIDSAIAPHADRWDCEERIPRQVLSDLAGLGVLGAHVSVAQGGGGRPVVEWGEALEAVGEASMSLLSVLTIHAMSSYALARWGEAEAQQEWLPSLTSGAKLGGFCLTEPTIGCDAKSVTTRLEEAGDSWRVNGTKRWTSAAELVDVFLVFGQTDQGPTAVLVPRETPGVTVTPISGVLGFRGARACELTFNDVVVPKRWTIGPQGLGFSYVASSTLDVGRFCIACGSTGLIRACVRASVDYARQRKQFGVPLSEHQLIQALIADMTTSYKAANALWRQAAKAREELLPSSIMETTTAKYFASTSASRAANDTVQIHGANGCGPDYPVQRYFRDARITELIEGSNQMQQVMIAQDALNAFATRRRR
jgi:glutaryl-CoA dehydrogenase (non-decarboxylating)